MGKSLKAKRQTNILFLFPFIHHMLDDVQCSTDWGICNFYLSCDIWSKSRNIFYSICKTFIYFNQSITISRRCVDRCRIQHCLLHWDKWAKNTMDISDRVCEYLAPYATTSLHPSPTPKVIQLVILYRIQAMVSTGTQFQSGRRSHSIYWLDDKW